MYPLKTNMDSHALDPDLMLDFVHSSLLFTILPRKANGTPGRPHEVSGPIVKHVTNAINLCRVMLIQPKVLDAFKTIATRYSWAHKDCWYLEALIGKDTDKVTYNFISSIIHTFPLVFVDYTLKNPDSKAFHIGRPWNGDFEPRHQSISIDGKGSEHMSEAFETAAVDPSHFQISLFKTAHVLLQEMGHVFVTYLSRGQNEETRPKVKGPHGASVSDFFAADCALDEKLFNGTIHYVRDPLDAMSDDQCGTPYLETRAGAYHRIFRRPIEDIASYSEFLPIPNDFTSDNACTINDAFPLEFTFPYYHEKSPEKEKLKTVGEGHPPDTYTDPLEEKEAAWLLKEYQNNTVIIF